jgi:hypothetical protein
MTDAPACPLNLGQPIPGKRVFHRGDPWHRDNPWSRPEHLQDMVNSIPRATNLSSAIRALHIMNQIIQMVNRGEPVVNNTRVPGEPDVKEKGNDYNPHYQPFDWVQEGREFTPQKLYNPDNQEQYVEIKTVTVAFFFNGNTDYRLNYYSRI